MHKTLIISFLLTIFIGGQNIAAQPKGFDVFSPIAKYIAKGDAESLSKWFADNLEVTILTNTTDASKEQARQIVKAFFDNYTPRSFTLTHTAGRANMKYALATLNAGGERFMLTIFVCSKDGKDYSIQQFKVQRLI